MMASCLQHDKMADTNLAGHELIMTTITLEVPDDLAARIAHC